MKKVYLLLMIGLYSCGTNEENEKDNSPIVIESSNIKEHFSGTDNSNLNKDKLDLLCQKWTLVDMYMINENGDKNQFSQPPLTLTFRNDFTAVTESESMGIKAENRWGIDSLFTSFILEGISINGSRMETPTMQKNKIIQLNNNQLVYTYDDPVTGMTIEMYYKKD